GATAIEYGLIAALVGVSIIVGLESLRDALNAILAQISAELNGV
ncbi:MAG: Flp family type IVb pilin, partial [Hyphomicrobium sp.]